MAKQTEQTRTETPWAKIGATRAQYKRGVEASIRCHVCDDTKILRELFARKAR